MRDRGGRSSIWEPLLAAGASRQGPHHHIHTRLQVFPIWPRALYNSCGNLSLGDFLIYPLCFETSYKLDRFLLNVPPSSGKSFKSSMLLEI